MADEWISEMHSFKVTIEWVCLESPDCWVIHLLNAEVIPHMGDKSKLTSWLERRKLSSAGFLSMIYL